MLIEDILINLLGLIKPKMLIFFQKKKKKFKKVMTALMDLHMIIWIYAMQFPFLKM